jgi:mannose-1-phosphate guanylyltransferase
LLDDPEAIIVVETADHVYSDIKAYIKNLKAGVEMAKNDKIVLIGIKPTFPHTGLGYIHEGRELTDEGKEIKIFDIANFKEKPDYKTARQFVESGKYLWNSGIFISKAKVMLKSIKEHMPNLHNALSRIDDSGFDEQVIFKEFEKLESISIDYGVMEKAKNTVVIRGEFPWDDVGDWEAMDRVHTKDSEGNVIIGKYKGEAKNCIIFGEKKLIDMDKIDGLVVVDTSDCLLVAKKERALDVKKIVDMLEKDEKLKKYALDFVKNPEFNYLQIDCKNLDIKSNKLVATIGLNDIIIEETDEKIVVKHG